MTNPYSGKHFFDVLFLFIQRMWALISGQIGLTDLATDEIQVFVLALVAIASGLVGTFLVLKRMSMLANSLSHTVLLGIVFAFLILFPFLSPESQHAHGLSIPILLLAALVAGLLTTFLTQALVKWLALSEDVSTGLVFTTLFALGILLVSAFMRSTHLGVEAIMGNVDALHLHDLSLIFWIAVSDAALILLLYRGWQITSFDPCFAKTVGFSNNFFHFLLMLMTSVTVIGAFRAVGVLLVLSFLVTPFLISRLICHRLHHILFLTVGLGIGSSLISVALGRHLLSAYGLALSTSGLIVTLLGVGFIFAILIRLTTKRLGVKLLK